MMTKLMETILSVDTRSPRKIMQMVPAAPMPVHTAYAGPTSSFFSERVSRPKTAQREDAEGDRRPAAEAVRELQTDGEAGFSSPATTTSSHAMSRPPV